MSSSATQQPRIVTGLPIKHTGNIRFPRTDLVLKPNEQSIRLVYAGFSRPHPDPNTVLIDVPNSFFVDIPASQFNPATRHIIPTVTVSSVAIKKRPAPSDTIGIKLSAAAAAAAARNKRLRKPDTTPAPPPPPLPSSSFTVALPTSITTAYVNLPTGLYVYPRDFDPDDPAVLLPDAVPSFPPHDTSGKPSPVPAFLLRLIIGLPFGDVSLTRDVTQCAHAFTKCVHSCSNADLAPILATDPETIATLYLLAAVQLSPQSDKTTSLFARGILGIISAAIRNRHADIVDIFQIVTPSAHAAFLSADATRSFPYEAAYLAHYREPGDDRIVRIADIFEPSGLGAFLLARYATYHCLVRLGHAYLWRSQLRILLADWIASSPYYCFENGLASRVARNLNVLINTPEKHNEVIAQIRFRLAHASPDERAAIATLITSSLPLSRIGKPIIAGLDLYNRLVDLATRLILKGKLVGPIAPPNPTAWKPDSAKLILPKNTLCLSAQHTSHTHPGKLFLFANVQSPHADFCATAICMSSKHAATKNCVATIYLTHNGETITHAR